jgi:glycosyltransferase involved in cell wall biosynthesis
MPMTHPMSADLPRVSIIITSYNYGHFLKRSIDSCLDQQYPNLEVIVVDDGSTDSSYSIAGTYANRICLLRQPNKGQAAAFNHGVAYSNGQIIWFVDSDDYLLPGAVSTIVSHWKTDVAMISGVLRVIDQHQKQVEIRPGRIQPFTTQDRLLDFMARTGRVPFAPTTGNAYGRGYLLQALPIPESLFVVGAEAYLNRKLPFLGRLVQIDHAVGVYRRHGSNIQTRSRYEPRLLAIRIKWEEEAFNIVVEESHKRHFKIHWKLVHVHYDHLRNVIFARALGQVAEQSACYSRFQLLKLVKPHLKKHGGLSIILMAAFALATLTPCAIGKPVVRCISKIVP